MVKDGYRRTEIGIIPEDWEIKNILSLVPKNKKYGIVDGPFGSNLKTIHYKKQGIPIITSGYVTNGIFKAEYYLYVDLQKFKSEKRSAVGGGDIVMAKIGANCGASAIMPKNHKIGILSGNALKITIDVNLNNTYYIWQVLWNLYKTEKIDEIKTVGAQPAISISSLKKYLIPIPQKEEQKAIAKVLSDTDELISTLEKLISKKEAIKQGTMQQLLTGKKRLNGFNEEWEEKRLGNIFKITAGQSKSRFIDNGDNYIIDMGSVSSDGKLITSKKTSLNKDFLNIGNLIMPKDDIGGGNIIGKVAYINLDNKYILGDHVFKLENIRENSLFLYYFINSYSINQEFRRKASGSAQLGISKSSVEEQLLKIPNDTKEQQAIAQILSDMDSEIEFLKQKLSKTKAIKDGMMSELLTGKTRLIKKEDKAKKHNIHFEDAVIIGVLSDLFSNDKFPLGRKRYTKLSYLLHRKKEHSTQQYLKKAAGPYNHKTKYGGAEKIALNKNYIKHAKSGKLYGFVSDKNSNEAKEYFIKWFGDGVIDWLEQFRYYKNEKLELLATVDMAMQDLVKSKQSVNLENVKTIIKSDKEWKPKLEREIFNNENIENAINTIYNLFWSKK